MSSENWICSVHYGISTGAGVPPLVPGTLNLGSDELFLIPDAQGGETSSIHFPFRYWENANGSKDKPDASEESRYLVRIQYREDADEPLTTAIVQFKNPEDYIVTPTSYVDSPAALNKAHFLSVARKVKAERRPPKLEPVAAPASATTGTAVQAGTVDAVTKTLQPESKTPTPGVPGTTAGTTAAPGATAAASSQQPTTAPPQPPRAPRISPEEEQRRLRIEEEQRLHARVLATSPTAKILHETLVEKARALSESEFWAFRSKDLDDAANRFELQSAAVTYKDLAAAAAQQGKPAASSSSETSTSSSSSSNTANNSNTGGPSSSASKQEVLTQLERIKILLDYPFVFRAYQNNVPHKMSETAFWNHYALTQRSLDHDLRVQRTNDIFAIARQELREQHLLGSAFIHRAPDSIRTDTPQDEDKRPAESYVAAEVPASLLGERRRRPQTSLLAGNDLMLDIADHPQWGRDVFAEGATGDVPLARLPAAQRVEAEAARAAVDRLNRFGYVALNRVGDLTEAALAAAETPSEAAVVALQAKRAATETLREASTGIDVRAKEQIEKLGDVPLVDSSEERANVRVSPGASPTATPGPNNLLDLRTLHRKQVQREAVVEDLTAVPPPAYQVLKVKPLTRSATEARAEIQAIELDDELENVSFVFKSKEADLLAKQILLSVYNSPNENALPSELTEDTGAPTKRIRLSQALNVFSDPDPSSRSPDAASATVQIRSTAFKVRPSALPRSQAAFLATRVLSAKIQAQSRASQVTEAQASLHQQTGQRTDVRMSFHTGSTSGDGEDLVTNTTIPLKVRTRLIELFRIVCELSRHYWATVDDMDARDALRKIQRLSVALEQQGREVRRFRDELNASGLSVHAELLMPLQQILEKVYSHYERIQPRAAPPGPGGPTASGVLGASGAPGVPGAPGVRPPLAPAARL